MNDDITIACIKNHVYKYEIAQKLGVTDTTLSRKLRLELSKKEKEKILNIIENIRKERN
jgi:predicted XRE-type DNA-binding protein